MTGEWSKVLTLDELAKHVDSWDVYANGEPDVIAAFALHGLLGDISEDVYCGWVDAVCVETWGWILSRPITPPRAFTPETIAADTSRCRLFAEAGGWWWASYDFAVPLAEWEAKHGAMPRGEQR
jgi:hypothetical protein